MLTLRFGKLRLGLRRTVRLLLATRNGSEGDEITPLKLIATLLTETAENPSTLKVFIKEKVTS